MESLEDRVIHKSWGCEMLLLIITIIPPISTLLYSISSISLNIVPFDPQNNTHGRRHYSYIREEKTSSKKYSLAQNYTDDKGESQE